jgi:hypothetical protein
MLWDRLQGGLDLEIVLGTDCGRIGYSDFGLIFLAFCS